MREARLALPTFASTRIVATISSIGPQTLKVPGLYISVSLERLLVMISAAYRHVAAHYWLVRFAITILGRSMS